MNSNHPPADAEADAGAHPHLRREYWCFISYRHADNREPGRQWATWLHQALETYEVPADLIGTKNERGDTIPERIFPVFRDEVELPADAELSHPIESALRRSRFLLVLCSPNAVQSRFVADEILRFKQLGKQDRILAAIIAGEPGGSDAPGQAGATQECFPAPLRFTLDAGGQLTTQRTEPIAANFRLADGAPGWTSPAAYREALKAAGIPDSLVAASVTAYAQQQSLMLLKIVAGVLGVPLGVLTQRDKAYQLEKQKQRARVLRRWLVLVGVVGAAAVVAGLMAFSNGQAARKSAIQATNEATRATREGARAEDERIKAQQRELETKQTLSMADFRRADALIAEHRQAEALAYLARAVRVAPGNAAAARRALFVLQQGEWWWPRALKAPAGMEMLDASLGLSGAAHVLAASPEQEGKQRSFAVFAEGKALFPERSFAGSGLVARFVPDTELFTTQGDEGAPQLWSGSSGEAAEAPEEWSRDRKTAATALKRGLSNVRYCTTATLLAAWVPGARSIRVYDRSNSKRTHATLQTDFSISEAVFTPDAERLIIAGGIDIEDSHQGDIATVSVWGDPRLKHWAETGPLFDHAITFMRLMPDGESVIISSQNAAEQWSLEGRRLYSFTEAHDKPRSGVLAAAPDGQTLVVGEQYWQRWGRHPIPKWPGEDASDADTTPDPLLALAKSNPSLSKGEWSWCYRDPADGPDGPAEMDLYHLERTADDSILVGANKRGRGVILDGKSGSVLQRFTCAEFSEVVAAAATRFIIRNSSGAEVWDVATAKGTGVKFSSFDTVVTARFHPDGRRVLIASEDRRGQMWDAATGAPLGDPILFPDFSSRVQFARDGTWFVSETTNTMLGAGSFQVWDTATMLPLSDPISSRNIGGSEGEEVALLEGAHLGDAGKLCLRSTVDSLPEGQPGGATLVFHIPAADQPVPAWFPDFCEAVARLRITDAGAVQPVSDADRTTKLDLTRKALAAAGADDILAAVVRWWTDETPERKLSPLSQVRVLDTVEKRLTQTSPVPLEQAFTLVPKDARIPARLSRIYGAMATQASKRGDDFVEATARAALRSYNHERRALALDPSVIFPEITLPPPR